MAKMKYTPVIAAICAALSMGAQAAPLDEPVIGPMQVCFKYSSFSLADGERVTDFEASAEAMALRVESPKGVYRIGESEGFATPKHALGVQPRRGVGLSLEKSGGGIRDFRQLRLFRGTHNGDLAYRRGADRNCARCTDIQPLHYRQSKVDALPQRLHLRLVLNRHHPVALLARSG